MKEIKKHNASKLGGGFFEASRVKNFFEKITHKDSEQSLYVFSAKAGMTNLLEEISLLGGNDSFTRDLSPLLLKFYEDHAQLAAGLCISSKNETKKVLDGSYEKIGELARDMCMDKSVRRASILQMGELVSSEIISIYLHSIGIYHLLFDARDYLIADRHGTVKKVLEFPEHFTKKKILITQGFISKDENRTNTTLQRNGSDLSLACFAINLKKPSIPLEVTFYKDFPGVYNLDPAIHKEKARLLTNLSEPGYLKLCKKNNAYPVFPEAIEALQNMKYRDEVKVNIKSYLDLTHPGTTIGLCKF